MKRSNILFLVFIILFSISCDDIERINRNTDKDESGELLSSNQNDLFDILKEKDSLLFDLGFNQVDTLMVIELISKDFEFYHDEHGITNSKTAFVNNIKGIKDLPFKTRRELINGSMEVYPLYKNNNRELYGAIQIGEHNFYQQKEGEVEQKTNVAKFTHLWIIEENEWKLRRVLSFNHKVPID